MSHHLATTAREPRQKPVGSRFYVRLFAAALLLTLPSCGLLPISHYTFNTLPLSPEQGWVQLPTARWLVNPGIDPDVMTFCPATHCGEQAFVARIELTGRETGFADALIADPARALSSTVPTHKNRKSQRVTRVDVAPLTIAGWAGGNVRLESRKDRARAAHVAIVAMRQGSRAYLLMAVARGPEEVVQRLRLAIR